MLLAGCKIFAIVVPKEGVVGLKEVENPQSNFIKMTSLTCTLVGLNVFTTFWTAIGPGEQ